MSSPLPTSGPEAATEIQHVMKNVGRRFHDKQFPSSLEPLRPFKLQGQAGNGGLYGESIHNDPEEGKFFVATFLPHPVNDEQIYYALVSARDSVDSQVILNLGWTDGSTAKTVWDPDTGFWHQCWLKGEDFKTAVSFINAHWFTQDTKFPDVVPEGYKNYVEEPVPDEPMSDPTPSPPTSSDPPPSTEPTTGNVETPGGFAANVPGLPSKPGWFKTPAGFCRKWEPWERAILQHAQEKSKKELEAWMNKMDCHPPKQRCTYTSRY